MRAEEMNWKKILKKTRRIIIVHITQELVEKSKLTEKGDLVLCDWRKELPKGSWLIGEVNKNRGEGVNKP